MSICVAGSDYESNSLVLSIASGASSGCVEVVTVEDNLYEDTESFIAALEPSERVTVIGSPDAVVNIEDDDNGEY